MVQIFREAIPSFVQTYLGAPDHRVKDWIFLNSPLWLFGVLATYFAIIYGLAKIMNNHKPFGLRGPLIVYNSFQVLFSGYICKEIFMSAYLSGYKLSCTDYDLTPSKLNIRMATAFWSFYLSKIIDLADTVFFVLRKKWNQLSFLHIYHHSSMIFNWYLGVLYLPGGQAFFSVLLNSFVHVIMYTYYLLSAMGPVMQKYLWWKKYLTQIQLIQFLAVMFHILLGYQNKCKAPIWLTWFTVTYLWTLVFLFGNFYYKTYKSTKKIKIDLGQFCSQSGLLDQPVFDNNIDYQAGGDYKRD
ncbi:hypothetical protein Trydic_g18078 [Trypoxylus dichotomus]